MTDLSTDLDPSLDPDLAADLAAEFDAALAAVEAAAYRKGRIAGRAEVRDLLAFGAATGSAESAAVLKALARFDESQHPRDHGKFSEKPGAPAVADLEDDPGADKSLFRKGGAAHAPKGGVTVQGNDYAGGQFIPAEVMAEATEAERAAVEGDKDGPPPKKDESIGKKPADEKPSGGAGAERRKHDPSDWTVEDWEHAPTARSANRWRNLHTGAVRYAKTSPKGRSEAARRAEAQDRERRIKSPAALAPGSKEAAAAWEENTGVAAEELVAVMDGVPGARVQTYAGANGTYIYGTIGHPDATDWTRTLSVNPDGSLRLTNNVFFLRPKAQGGGMGTQAFASQVRGAVAAGVSTISTCAGRGSYNGVPMNGYRTWPTLGYDAALTESERKRLPEPLRGARTVQDLYATADGKAWWATHGDTRHMTFDVSPGSRSLAVLNAYLTARGAEPVEYTAERHAENQARAAARAGRVSRAEEQKRAAVVHAQYAERAQAAGLDPAAVRAIAEESVAAGGSLDAAYTAAVTRAGAERWDRSFEEHAATVFDAVLAAGQFREGVDRAAVLSRAKELGARDAGLVLSPRARNAVLNAILDADEETRGVRPVRKALPRADAGGEGDVPPWWCAEMFDGEPDDDAPPKGGRRTKAPPADEPDAHALIAVALDVATRAAADGSDAAPVLAALYDLGHDPARLAAVLDGGEVYQKAYHPDQPRDDHGRWVKLADLRAAKKNPKLAARLKKKVTDPAERKKLDKVLSGAADIGTTAKDRAKEATAERRKQKVADRDEARRLRNELFKAHQAGEPLDADTLHSLIPHLTTLSHAELTNLRVFLGGAGLSFGGERKLDERRARALAWAKAKALESRMDEHGFSEEEKASALAALEATSSPPSEGAPPPDPLDGATIDTTERLPLPGPKTNPEPPPDREPSLDELEGGPKPAGQERSRRKRDSFSPAEGERFAGDKPKPVGGVTPPIAEPTPPTTGTEHPRDRLGRLRAAVPNAANGFSPQKGEAVAALGNEAAPGVYSVVGVSRDGATYTIRPDRAGLTADQKQRLRKEPGAYDRKVSAGEVIPTTHAGIARRLTGIVGDADTNPLGANLVLDAVEQDLSNAYPARPAVAPTPAPAKPADRTPREGIPPDEIQRTAAAFAAHAKDAAAGVPGRADVALSVMNTFRGKASVAELRQFADAVGVDSRGTRDAIGQRLVAHALRGAPSPRLGGREANPTDAEFAAASGEQEPAAPADGRAALLAETGAVEEAGRREATGWNRSGADRIRELRGMVESGRPDPDAIAEAVRNYANSEAQTGRPTGAAVRRLAEHLLAGMTPEQEAAFAASYRKQNVGNPDAPHLAAVLGRHEPAGHARWRNESLAQLAQMAGLTADQRADFAARIRAARGATEAEVADAAFDVLDEAKRVAKRGG